MNVALLTKIGVSALLASALSLPAHAEVINTDWKSAGDNLVITDTATGLEFLKLSETMGRSVDSVIALLDTSYTGWRISTGSEASSMLSNLLDDTLSYYGGFPDYIDGGESHYYNMYDVDYSKTRPIVGSTSANNYFYSFGLALSGSNDIRMYGFNQHKDGHDGWVYSNMGPIQSSQTAYQYGVWLVRDAQNISESPISNVPVPLMLSSLAMLGFGLSRRKQLVR